MAHRTKHVVSDAKASFFKKALPMGILSGVLCWLALLYVVSFGLMKTENPYAFVLPAAFALAGVSSAVAGFVCAKMSDMPHMVSGIAAGILLCILLFTLSLVFMAGKDSSNLVKVFMLGDILLFSAAGATLSGIKREKRRKRR